MSTTFTGSLTIGFRRGWAEWQKNLTSLTQWSVENGFEVLDMGGDDTIALKQVIDAGLRIGTVDLPGWQRLISPSAATREDAVATAAAFIEERADLGPLNYFVVMLPEQPELPRSENFGYMVESFNALSPALESAKARIAIEGWPGPGALCCTPEGYRKFFEACPSPSMGINYDPSHLIRMGIDPIKFLQEFAGCVSHVHGKDTEVFPDHLYEYGYEQPATFARSFGFGGAFWRYTIPGNGAMRWLEGLGILTNAGYTGSVCIELEDENYNGSEEGEKAGLIAGRNFLQSV